LKMTGDEKAIVMYYVDLEGKVNMMADAKRSVKLPRGSENGCQTLIGLKLTSSGLTRLLYEMISRTQFERHKIHRRVFIKRKSCNKFKFLLISVHY
jgi:hypothetical protein